MIIEENKNNINMNGYLNSKLLFINKDKNIFSNEKFFLFCKKYKKPEEIINLYKEQFYIVIDFIDEIINNIINNKKIIPYPIKCLCKIISELITNKFPSMNTYDKNIFIAKFFIGKLLIPFLSNININIYINENTFYNLKIIFYILNKYISGDFFTSNDSELYFTPFNWYFIFKYEKNFNIYKDILNCKIPQFLEKFIGNKLLSDYEYDYFKENPDKYINSLSILYNIEQIRHLIYILDKHKNIFNNDSKNKRLQKAMEKLMANNCQEKNEKLLKSKNEDYHKYKERKNSKKNKEKEEKDSKIIIHYFLFIEFDTNPKNKKLKYIKNTDNFTLLHDYKWEKENKINKLKNVFCNILYNNKILDKYGFNSGTTEEILKELS